VGLSRKRWRAKGRIESFSACHKIIDPTAAIEKSCPSNIPPATITKEVTSCPDLFFASPYSWQPPQLSPKIPSHARATPAPPAHTNPETSAPFKSSKDQVIIQKSGSDCPTGFYKAGSYCKRLSSSDREALPREDGGKCPTGWYQSGQYCVKQ
jgi:hypothetical protein